ncbi:hypothetical protein Tco_0205778 [Tanacetum coccineum]
MTSQDARLSKFEADFKQQQSEMANKIDTVLKAITDRIAGALPSDTLRLIYNQRKFLIKNKEEIFTLRGDGVRIKPDDVASLAM